MSEVGAGLGEFVDWFFRGLVDAIVAILPSSPSYARPCYWLDRLADLVPWVPWSTIWGYIVLWLSILGSKLLYNAVKLVRGGG